MNFTLELNKNKLNAVADAMQVVAENINMEIHHEKQRLEKVEQLNLATEKEGGIMDFHVEEKRSLLKFLTTQEDLMQSIIKMAR